MDITQYFSALKQRNEYEEAEIDKVFLMRQERERAVSDVEAQIKQIQVGLSSRSSLCLFPTRPRSPFLYGRLARVCVSLPCLWCGVCVVVVVLC